MAQNQISTIDPAFVGADGEPLKPSDPIPKPGGYQGGTATGRARCEVCDWPLAESPQQGCVPGNCSYRPEDPAEQRRIAERRADLATGAARHG